MAKLTILNSKRTRMIMKMIQDRWGADLEAEGIFLENEKGKIFLVSREFGELDIDNLNIQSVGTYFAEIAHDEIRLSIEGSQIVGPRAGSNIIEIDDDQAKAWISGSDLTLPGTDRGFFIVKNRDDFLGTGKHSQGKLSNYVPKSRRITIID